MVLKAMVFWTRFTVDDNKGGDNYIYRIPDCTMPRLFKGDNISLHLYRRGQLYSDLEVWVVEVVRDPELTINWSDPVDKHKDAYDVESVYTMQKVHVKVLSHKYV